MEADSAEGQQKGRAVVLQEEGRLGRPYSHRQEAGRPSADSFGAQTKVCNPSQTPLPLNL